MLDNIITVLTHNSHPGNIGAAARALKNMGLSHLTLVAPKKFPSPEADARAAHATDILESAKVYPTLKEALHHCNLIFGTSARTRTLSLPTLSPREAAAKIKTHFHNDIPTHSHSLTHHHNDKVALLFGNEQHGLSNEELELCHFQIKIPCNPHYSSLNIASAVQIIAYEIFCISYAQDPIAANSNTSDSRSPSALSTSPNAPLPTFQALDEFYQTLERTLIDIHFLDPKQPGQLMTRLKRLFARANIDKTELTLLRGILSAIQQRER